MIASGADQPDARLAAIDAVVYAAVFASAVTFDELWRYARRRIDRPSLRVLMDDEAVRRVVRESQGMYHLGTATQSVRDRGRRQHRAGILERRARRVAGVIRHFPFVRGVVLTGSAAAADADAGADVDLLIIVAPARLATVFLALGSAARMVGRSTLCPNYYMAERALPGAADDLYLAREVAQSQVLAGDIAGWSRAVSWVTEWFPNLADSPPARAPLSCGGSGQRLIERALGGRVGDAIERTAGQVALRRLRAHHRRFQETVPAAVLEAFRAGAELRFHGGRVGERIMAAYRAHQAAAIAALDRPRDEAEGAAR